MRKIIFLDIDGVLNSLGHKDYFESIIPELVPELLDRLGVIYHTTNAEIVLSSTWRIMGEENVMYKNLVKALQSRGMSISYKTPELKHDRPLEIHTWLKDNILDREEVAWVSLDDDFSHEEYAKYGYEKHLVRTLFYCNYHYEGGITEDCVTRAIDILNNKLPDTLFVPHSVSIKQEGEYYD